MVGTRRHRVAMATGIVALTLFVPAGPVGAADPPPTATIIFEGGGWGHGIGLSQYGAKAQALAGRTAEEITGFYYPGTEVVAAAELPIPPEEFEQPIWVGLTQHRTTATLSWPDTTGTVCIDPDPSCLQTIAIDVDEQVRFEWATTDDHCTITRIEADGGEVPLSAIAPGCRASAVAAPGGAIWLGAQGYAVGSIELRRALEAESFHVVAVIDMETYVAGLAEMPTSWPATAQQAQMLAGRTFALNRYLHFENPELRTPGDAGIPDTQRAKCWCHVYDTTASQVYGGIEATTPERVAAAAATSGHVIAYLGSDAASYTKSNVIESLYSSSNGGRTMANTDAFGSTKQYPYLIAVDDPWSIDPTAGNPNAEWVAERTPDAIADRLGWDELRGIWLVDTDPSLVRFEGISGGEIVVEDRKGDSLRGVAQLLSGHVTEIRVQGVPTCNGYFATLWGTSQADTLIGTAAHDVILGRGGDDFIEGQGGHDIICAGTGDDTIWGNRGDDRIYAGAGHDIVFGNAGFDVVFGGGGRDTIDGGGSADDLVGNAGDDTIIGGFGADTLRGGGGTDVLDGQGGADRLAGNTGDDHLIGGAHSDRLNGGPDSDTLDGSDGYNDRCTGGSGVDTASEACEIVDSVP